MVLRHKAKIVSILKPLGISPRDGEGDSLLLVLFTSWSLWPKPANTKTFLLMKDVTCEWNDWTTAGEYKELQGGEK